MKINSKFTYSLLITVGLSSITSSANAVPDRVERPFPQLDKYDHVTMMTASDTSLFSVKCGIVKNYEAWYDNYVADYPNSGDSGKVILGEITGGGGTGPEWQGTDAEGISASEHTGYGMIIAALMAGYEKIPFTEICRHPDPSKHDPKTLFDGLVELYETFPSKCWTKPSGSKNMSWIVPRKPFWTDGSGNQVLRSTCSASDGDMDIAYALLLADVQWGSGRGNKNYRQLAIDLLNDILEFDISNENLILGGNYVDKTSTSDLGRYISRSSDWMVGHFPAFNSVVKDSRWDAVRQKVYDIYDDIKGQGNNIGLTPDFVDTRPTTPVAYGPIGLCEPFPTQFYSENASRTPWRIMADYIHYPANAKSKDIAEDFSNFVAGELDTNGNQSDWDPIRNSYKLNGGKISMPGDWDTVTATGEHDPEATSAAHKCDGHDESHPSFDADQISKSAVLGQASASGKLHFVAPLLAAYAVRNANKPSAEWKNTSNGYHYLMNHPKTNYFGDSIKIMNELLLSGNWWAPYEIESPVSNKTYNATKQTNYNSLQNAIDNADFGDNLVVTSQTLSSPVSVHVSGLKIVGQDTGSGLPKFKFNNNSSTALAVEHGVSGVVISNFVIEGGRSGIANAGADTYIGDVYFSDLDEHGIYATGSGGRYLRNTFSGIRESAIYASHLPSGDPLVYISRNVFEYNLNGFADVYDIALYGNTTGLIYHNTFYDGSIGVFLNDTTGTTLIRNNIFQNKYTPMIVENGTEDADLFSNTTYANTFDDFPAGYNDPKQSLANPLLDANYELTAGSPAIDSGFFLRDYGVTDGLPDRGAFEYFGSAAVVPVNLLQNGDFSDDLNHWFHWATAGGAATFSGSAGHAFTNITDDGDEKWSVGLAQDSFTLENSKSYRVTFRAKSTGARGLQVLVGMNEGPWAVYSSEQQFTLSSSWQTFSFDFTMTQPDDDWSQLQFDMGDDSTRDVYIDDVSLIELP